MLITNSKEEIDLINAAIQNGDTEGWKFIYNRYFRPIFGYLRKNYYNEPANIIEDLTQQTFIRLLTAKTKPLFEHLKQFDKWLYKAAVCTANDYFDTVVYQNDKLTDQLDDQIKCVNDISNFEFEINTNENTQAPNDRIVEEVLNLLIERDKKLLIMRAEHTPYSIISKELGIQENSLGVYFQRAVEKFKKKYNEYMGGNSDETKSV